MHLSRQLHGHLLSQLSNNCWMMIMSSRRCVVQHATRGITSTTKSLTGYGISSISYDFTCYGQWYVQFKSTVYMDIKKEYHAQSRHISQQLLRQRPPRNERKTETGHSPRSPFAPIYGRYFMQTLQRETRSIYPRAGTFGRRGIQCVFPLWGMPFQMDMSLIPGRSNSTNCMLVSPHGTA